MVFLYTFSAIFIKSHEGRQHIPARRGGMYSISSSLSSSCSLFGGAGVYMLITLFRAVGPGVLGCTTATLMGGLMEEEDGFFDVRG